MLGTTAFHLGGGGPPEAVLPYNAILVVLMTTIAVFTSLGHILTVRRAVSGHGTRCDGSPLPRTHLTSETWLCRSFPFLHALTRLVPFAVLVVLSGVWVQMSPSAVFTHRPRLVLWTLGLLFAKLVTHLMVAHLCAVEYHPLRRTLMPVFYVAFHTGLLMLLKRKTLGIDEVRGFSRRVA